MVYRSALELNMACAAKYQELVPYIRFNPRIVQSDPGNAANNNQTINAELQVDPQPGYPRTAVVSYAIQWDPDRPNAPELQLHVIPGVLPIEEIVDAWPDQRTMRQALGIPV